MRKVDDLYMLDGRRYFTADGWQTIRADRPDGRRVTGDEAKVILLLAIYQSGTTRNENVETRR